MRWDLGGEISYQLGLALFGFPDKSSHVRMFSSMRLRGEIGFPRAVFVSTFIVLPVLLPVVLPDILVVALTVIPFQVLYASTLSRD